MKRPATIIIGFIAGLAISGVLGDLIIAASSSAGRISSAWSISKAEKFYAGGNFSESLNEYEKALGKVKPDNKKLIAKIKNNQALNVFAIADKAKDKSQIKKSLELFNESLKIYEEIKDTQGAAEVNVNIGEAKKALKELK
ncbi:hypothetical protein [Endomicrobium proavitum]|uniref:Tetratricopeptide repeat protein n=1 Tax=Endomicrobium proavitum TaxID=1408281 RepID=A0A0G3WK65_9BACT|nr:hypothetical protein [Endomicrobium proavitum]AKL98290.1 exported protein of unknown function [Endomicrobium proavitum]